MIGRDCKSHNFPCSSIAHSISCGHPKYAEDFLNAEIKFPSDDGGELAWAYFQLGELLIENNDTDGSLANYLKCLDLERKLYDSNSTEILGTLDSITESIHLLRDHMTTQRIDESEKTEKIDLPPSIVSKMVINKFNTKYENISEDEKKIIKSILNGSEEDKKNLHTEMVRECVDTIDSKLDESDINLKGKLLSAKDKLLRMSYNEETYTSDISKIYNLKESVETE